MAMPGSAEPMALFGGTFDPVHYGHLRCADEARRKLGLKYLYLFPAGIPPHRDVPRATAKQRLAMLQLACREFPCLRVDDRETRRQGPSYMVDTLRELRNDFPDRPLLLLIGQDAANLLHTWYHWEELFDLAHLVILTRPGAAIEYPHELAKQIEPRAVSDVREITLSKVGKVLHLEVESIDVSSSAIKSIIASGRSPGPMLPPAVLQYINENRLYLSA